ncbi:type II secretion system protein N, partial [Ralstonia solanacearum]
MTVQQSSRLLSLVLFAALCALLAHWVLTLSSLRSLSVPREARVAQTEALETGAAVTLFGGGPQSGPRDVQVAGVVADLADGSGAAIVSIDGGPPQAIRAGKALSPSLKLVEIKARSVVIERNGVRQEIALPASAVAGISPAGRNAPLPLPPSGAAAPMATPAMPPP